MANKKLESMRNKTLERLDRNVMIVLLLVYLATIEPSHRLNGVNNLTSNPKPGIKTINSDNPVNKQACLIYSSLIYTCTPSYNE